MGVSIVVESVSISYVDRLFILSGINTTWDLAGMQKRRTLFLNESLTLCGTGGAIDCDLPLSALDADADGQYSLLHIGDITTRDAHCNAPDQQTHSHQGPGLLG
jgi:hypothetical protein